MKALRCGGWFLGGSRTCCTSCWMNREARVTLCCSMWDNLRQGLHLAFGTSFQMGMASLSSFRMSKMPYVKLSLKSRSPCVKLSHIERHNVTRASRFIQQDVQHVLDPQETSHRTSRLSCKGLFSNLDQHQPGSFWILAKWFIWHHALTDSQQDVFLSARVCWVTDHPSPVRVDASTKWKVAERNLSLVLEGAWSDKTSHRISRDFSKPSLLEVKENEGKKIAKTELVFRSLFSSAKSLWLKNVTELVIIKLASWNFARIVQRFNTAIPENLASMSHLLLC